jgi:peptidyl-prolyl cis-trans isomerase C
MRTVTIAVVSSVLLLTCEVERSVPRGGAVVATGRGGLTITADELVARLEEQPAFVRAGYSSLEKKKELLTSVVRFEALAEEARRQGLDRDPEVLRAMRKLMVQKLVEARQQAAGTPVTEAEVSRYYAEHRAEFSPGPGEEPRPLEEVRAQLENKLQRQQRARAFEAWVRSLEEGAAVTVDERALEAVQLGP